MGERSGYGKAVDTIINLAMIREEQAK